MKPDIDSSFRGAFDMPRDVAYLNNAFHSPLLHASREAGLAGMALRGRPWEITPDRFFEEIEKSRKLFGRIIQGDSEGVAVVPSVSYGVGIAARNLSLPVGSRILIPEGEFPSNVYIWRELAREKRLEIVTVRRPQDNDWTRAVLEYLDERVSLVTAPPCHWCDGSRFDLTRIGKRAREVGAKFIVDGSQAIGTLPIDIKDWDPDYLVCVGYKWLLGPYGVSYLYVPERHRDGKPLEFGWLNRKGCEDFSRLCDYSDEFSAGARRFDVGQKSNPILLPMANAGLSTLLEWGLDKVARRIESVSTEIMQAVIEVGLSMPPLERRMNHILGVKTPHAREWAKKLALDQVFVSARQDSLRISPQVFNDTEDVERLKATLFELQLT